MVLRGAQIHRRGQTKCSLFSTQTLPYDLARLYGRALPFTSANLGNVAGLRLESVQILADSHGQEIVHCDSVKTSRRAPAAQPWPDAEEAFYVPGPCPDCPDAVHLDCRDMGLIGEREERHDVEKPEQSSAEQDYREAALKQDVDRPTASPRLQQKRSCTLCVKTRGHTYVFRSPDGGPYGL